MNIAHPSPRLSWPWQTLARGLAGFFLACLALLACALPLHAAVPGRNTLSKSSAPADLRAAVRRTLADDGWVETQNFTETDPGFDPEFGVSVAVHGNVAMIGAQQAKIGDNDGHGARMSLVF